MAKERLKSPRARLFVALDLPEAVRAGIVAWGTGALADPALRPVGPESLHVTLAFLGYLPEKEIQRVGGDRRGERGPGAPVELGIRCRVRSAVVRASSRFRPTRPGTIALQAASEERLVAARLYKPEKRPFWPHVTVARVRREERGSKRAGAGLESPRERFRNLSCSRFDGVRIVSLPF